MWLLEVKIEGKKFFLHDGECFIGANEERDIERVALENSAKIISVGGYQAVKVETSEELAEMIGGVPYNILQVSGGLLPFSSVEIVKEISHDSHL